VTEFAIQAAIRQAISAGHLGIHAGMHVGMHVVVALHLGRRAIRAIVVIFLRKRHCTGLERQVQPDGRKQSKGAATPGPALATDAGWMTQVIVSTKITEASATDPRASRATITWLRK